MFPLHTPTGPALRPSLRTLLLSAFLALTAVPFAPPAPAPAQELAPTVSVEGITEYRLDNGLRVLLFPDASKPQITVNVTYFVGSRHEAYGETGMAHLLEHLLFKGTPDHPDPSQELTERGARPNGTTWYDRTNYFETFPASDENLAWALDLEADRMVNSFVAAEDLASEMTVVRNEMESGENSPFRVLLERTLSTAYLWHNYGKSTIGARSDVENVPIGRLQTFYRKYYQPDNAMLVVAGQFDEARALELVQREFGAIPRPDRTGEMKIWPTYTTEPVQDGERSVTVRRVGDEQILSAAYHIPPGSHEDFAAVDVLTQVLGDSPSGRLYKALVEPKLAARASALSFQLKEAGPLFAYATLRPEQDLDEAWRAMDETLRAVGDAEPVTEEEVERARTALLKDVELVFNDSQRTALTLSEWAAMGDWRLFFLHRDRLEAVTVEDVNRVARTYLVPSNRTVGRFIPTRDPVRAEIPAEPDVEALVEGYEGRDVVAAGEAFDPSPANVDARTTTLTLANGLEVALLPKATRGGTVHGHLRLHFGNEEALWGRATAGEMAASMLMRGTERLSRQELNDELDRLKARLSIAGDATSLSGRFQTTGENLPALLRLLAEVVREPGFDADEFEVLKQQRLASLESQRSEPSARAQIALSRHTDPFPEGHPSYTPTLDEAIDAVTAVSLDDARAFHREFYGPQSGNLVLIGGFEADEVRSVVEETFADWASPHPYDRIASDAKDVEPDHVVIETPDKANAFFFARQNLALRDGDPDYPALALAGYMIGGGFLNSRLARRIRQEEGISYGVAARVSAHPVDRDGSFFAYAIYAPENADRLEAAFREEIRKVVEEGFRPEEFEAAREGYLESRHLSRSEDSNLAATLASNLYFDRTMAWDAEFEEKIRALTLEEVNGAVRRHLSLEEMTIVRAGDFEGAVSEPEGAADGAANGGPDSAGR